MTDSFGSNVLQHALEEFVASIRDVRLTQAFSFVTATIVIYDYLVCIEREIELIWKKRWSAIKLAFLWHRYFGLIVVLFQAYGQIFFSRGSHDPQCANDSSQLVCHQRPTASHLRGCRRMLTNLHGFSCSFWFYWETWGYCIVLFTTEAVLLLWIYIVYNKNRYILALMSICYLGEVGSVVAILTISFQDYQARAYGIPGGEYCVLTRVGSPFPLLWVPILAYDTLLLVLFIYRGCAGASPAPRCRLAYRYDSLLDMIYRHSLLNFLAIFASYLTCAVIWLKGNLGSYQAPVGFAVSLSITNCTRLLLNIRRAYYSHEETEMVLRSCRTPPLPMQAEESDDTLKHTLRRPHRPTRPATLLLLDARRPAAIPLSPLSPRTPMSCVRLSGSTLRALSPPHTPPALLSPLWPHTPPGSLRDISFPPSPLPPHSPLSPTHLYAHSPASTLRAHALGTVYEAGPSTGTASVLTSRPRKHSTRHPRRPRGTRTSMCARPSASWERVCRRMASRYCHRRGRA
ncbi:uncharacterized protein BXZ73DRAFT_102151 [Epithele typhae]|uniref:uncharacterized protein n=1 Tax=Epithele typhae TaxID=378194 RepID=UPI0020089349|nr:uncharacterized protein BXZ73DRAFT_102151 [Epithele typhae]KAH9929627.1 hypothetical protein BXZ73DRAFT_102151 [Epithele typhae]